MVLQEYLIIGKSSFKTITAGYNGDGELITLRFDGDFNDEQRKFGLQHCPVHLNQLPDTAKNLKWKIKPLDMDLSFENFYELYGYKEGKKRAQARWKKMTKEQQVKALLYIEKYNNKLKLRPGIQRKYPESYLNAEPWND